MDKSEWIPAKAAKADGTVYEALQIVDRFGPMVLKARSGYFLHDDGHWYRVSPPLRIEARVSLCRPTAAKHSEGRCS